MATTRYRDVVRTIIPSLVVAVVLLGAGCSSTGEEAGGSLNAAESARSGSFETAEETSGEPDWTGEQLNPFDLRSGQCFSEWSWFDEQFDRRINITAAVDCAQPHKKEVFHEAEFPAPSGAPFPGETLMTEWSTDLCYSVFADFVGLEYERSVYGIGFITPTRDTFEHPVGRHRRVACVLHHIDDEDLIGSVRQTAV